MNRFIRLSLITVALTSLASAAVVTMSSSATFTGGLDLEINSGLTNDATTRLVSTSNAASTSIDLTVVGQEDRLPLGTLIIGENVASGDLLPNITAAERDLGYQLNISVNTVEWGILNFLASPALFDLSNFNPGATDDDTTDDADEILVDLSSLFIDRTFGLVTVRFSIVDDEFGLDNILELNQGSGAETLFLRAEVLNIDQSSTVPEPATMAMSGIGLLALGALGRRFHRA